MATGRGQAGILEGIRIDLKRMHETWMELVYPRQVDADHTVLGKWEPSSTTERVSYRLWSALGVPAIALLYPLVLFGLAARFHARRIDLAAARVGLAGVVLVSLVVWGLLSALARFRFSGEGFIAVVAASLVATLAAVLAVLFGRVGGRVTSVSLAYPFGVTALFLPPVVAALYSPALAQVVLPRSYSIAEWLLNNVLTFADVNQFLRTRYDLEGVAYAGMWFGIAVPLGWFLGVVVTLADLVRPSS